jgi:hypothetical protein
LSHGRRKENHHRHPATINNGVIDSMTLICVGNLERTKSGNRPLNVTQHLGSAVLLRLSCVASAVGKAESRRSAKRWERAWPLQLVTILLSSNLRV